MSTWTPATTPPIRPRAPLADFPECGYLLMAHTPPLMYRNLERPCPPEIGSSECVPVYLTSLKYRPGPEWLCTFHKWMVTTDLTLSRGRLSGRDIGLGERCGHRGRHRTGSFTRWW